MNRKQLISALDAQKFAVDLSIRYHGHRIDAIRCVSVALQGFEVVACSAALISTFKFSIAATRSIIFVAGLSAGLALVRGLNSATARHYKKKAELGALAKKFPPDLADGDEALLSEILRDRAEIEKEDTRGFPCLDIICHNEVCVAWDRRNGEQPLTWVQRNLGAILPIPWRPPRA